MKHASNYDRINLIFDRYFEKSLKEGTRSDRGEGSQYLLQGDFTEMAESFLKNNQNKNELSDCLWNCSNFNWVIRLWSFPSSYSVLDPQVSVRPCEAEEADQRLVRRTLNLINNSYKNILIHLINTDVLVLLISYIGQVQLNDIEIHVCLINSDRYYNIRHHTRTWFW